MTNTHINKLPAKVISRKDIYKHIPVLNDGYQAMEWGLAAPKGTEAFSTRGYFKEWEDCGFDRNRVSTTPGWNDYLKTSGLEPESLKLFEGIMTNAGIHLRSNNDDYLIVTSENFIGYASTNSSFGYIYVTIFTKPVALKEVANG